MEFGGNESIYIGETGATPAQIADGAWRICRTPVYSIDIVNKDKRSEIGLAAAYGDVERLDRAISDGCAVTDVDEYQEQPLHLAAAYSQLAVAKVLIEEHHAPLDELNWEGWTPLCWAVVQGHLEMAQYLYDRGADIMWTTNQGWTPLHLAALANNLAMVEWLIGEGAVPDRESNYGCIPLSLARTPAVKRAILAATNRLA